MKQLFMMLLAGLVGTVFAQGMPLVVVGAQQPSLETIQVKNAKPSVIKERLDEVLKGLSPSSIVIADDRARLLICAFTQESRRLLWDLLNRLDAHAQVGDSEGKIRAYWIRQANPVDVATCITNQFRALKTQVVQESNVLLIYGMTKGLRPSVEKIIEGMDVPCGEYELVHTVLKIPNVKSADEALSHAMNAQGDIKAVCSRRLTCGMRVQGRDFGWVSANGDACRYALTVENRGLPNQFSWHLVCSNETSVICERSGTLVGGSFDTTLGAVMAGGTAFAFRLAVKSVRQPFQKDEEPCGDVDVNRLPEISESPCYVVGKDSVTVGKGDGWCVFHDKKPCGEYCVANDFAGKPVTRIGDYAFAGCNGLRKVIVPEGVAEIGMSAFLGCSSLQCVVLPTTVTNIGRFAFATTEALRVPDILCATGDKGRMRKLIKSVLLRDLPRSTASRPMLGGLLRRNGECKENTLCEVQECTPDAQREIEEALSRIREISEPEPPPVAKPEVKQDVPRQGLLARQGLLGGGSLRARRLQRQQKAAAAREAERWALTEQEKAQREAERAEQRAQLLAIQEELKRVREAKAAAEKQKGK